jgi:RNA polymerase sigma-70 factor (ECF subfamily)
MGTADHEFTDWYLVEHPKVFGSMVLLCRDRELANEVTDEAFARTLSRWERVGAMRSPGGWTHRVAMNLLRRSLRRSALEQRSITTLAAEMPAIGEHIDVWAAVAALPDRQREAVVLRYVADLPEAEIAAAMKVSRGTVASTLSDARKALARFLTDDNDKETVKP